MPEPLRIKKISIIIPAFKEQNKIAHSIKSISKVLKTLKYSHEIIVVVDGLVDDTYKIASKLNTPNLKVFSYEKNMGKGYAVRFGVAHAKGDVIGFIDAGMDIDPLAIPLLLEYLKLNDADIVLGSKLHPDSRIKYPLPRIILSWGYRKFAHLLFGLDVKDTQVGLKIFKNEVAKDIFKRTVVNRFAFDIEVLAVSHAFGHKKIVEAPIKLKYNNLSSITSSNFWKISIDTLVDTMGVFWRLKTGRYYDRIPK